MNTRAIVSAIAIVLTAIVAVRFLANLSPQSKGENWLFFGAGAIWPILAWAIYFALGLVKPPKG